MLYVESRDLYKIYGPEKSVKEFIDELKKMDARRPDEDDGTFDNTELVYITIPSLTPQEVAQLVNIKVPGVTIEPCEAGGYFITGNDEEIDKTKELIKKHDFHIKKQFGQNFLTDPNILRKIVQQANVDSNTLVVEIGPGMGALTEVLLANAKHVLAYEIDTTLIPILQESFADHPFTLIEGDVLDRNIDEDIKNLDLDVKKIVLVANLPYYITTPIIMKVLEESKLIQEYYVMMQLEVARRFTSEPRTKDYNSLSVFIQFKTTSSIIMKVPKQVFIPAPNVDSAIVKMVIKDKFERFPVNEELFYNLVRASFSMRRKTLVNNLHTVLNISKVELGEILEDLGFKSTVRAEELTVDDFITLSDFFAQI